MRGIGRMVAEKVDVHGGSAMDVSGYIKEMRISWVISVSCVAGKHAGLRSLFREPSFLKGSAADQSWSRVE